MDEIKRLRTLLAELMAKTKAITDKALAEERDTTDEETEKVEGFLAVIDTAKADLDKAESKAKTLARVAALSAPAPSGIPTPRLQPQGTDPVRVQVVGATRDRDTCHGYATPREFLNDVFTMAMTKREPEALRGLRISATAGSDEAGEYADPYGGYLVPEGFIPQLRMTSPEADPMGSAVTTIPMATGSVSFPARVDKTHSSSVSGGLRVYRRAEADTSASSRTEFEKIRIDATGLFGISYATEELIADSPISFIALLEQGFRDEFQSVIVNERLNGTGVGQMTGILNSGCVVSVAKETSQVAKTIVYENIVNMYSRLWGKDRGIWLVNHDCLPQLMQMTQSVGTGGVPVWQNSAIPGTPNTLIGLPVIMTEYTKTIGTVGDIILGNWSQYIQGVRSTLTGAESVHVRFTTAERCFRFMMRIGGACWWRSALTPKNSTTTLSPFVTLATRA